MQQKKNRHTGSFVIIIYSVTATASGCRGFEYRHANEKKPRTLTGTGLFLQGSSMGVERKLKPNLFTFIVLRKEF